MKLTSLGVDFLDADGLASQRLAEVDFLAVQTEAAAAGDHNGAVVERVVWFGKAEVRSVGSGVDVGRALHGESFVGTLLIEVVNEVIELGLLLKQIGTGGSSRFLLKS